MRNNLSYQAFYLTLLIGLALSLSALGQPTTAAQFEEQCYTWIEKRDLAKLVWTVRYYRSHAQAAFAKVLGQHREEPSREKERWLNTVARAFRLEGMERPNLALNKDGILWPITHWKGTMFQADGAQGEYDLHRTWD